MYMLVNEYEVRVFLFVICVVVEWGYNKIELMFLMIDIVYMYFFILFFIFLVVFLEFLIIFENFNFDFLKVV